MIKIEPQPKVGKPFRIKFANRGPEYWYNERIEYHKTKGRCGDMLYSWKCPYGETGFPRLIDGVWYWLDSWDPILGGDDLEPDDDDEKPQDDIPL